MTPVSFFKVVLAFVLILFVFFTLKNKQKINERIAKMTSKEWILVIFIAIFVCIGLGYLGVLMN